MESRFLILARRHIRRNRKKIFILDHQIKSKSFRNIFSALVQEFWLLKRRPIRDIFTSSFHHPLVWNTNYSPRWKPPAHNHQISLRVSSQLKIIALSIKLVNFSVYNHLCFQSVLVSVQRGTLGQFSIWVCLFRVQVPQLGQRSLLFFLRGGE